MRLVRTLVACTFAFGLWSCNPTISAVNARPEKYYQKKIELRGQILRTQQLRAEKLFDIADARGARILVHATGPVKAATGDWVLVKGLFVPQTRMGKQVYYDVLLGDRIRRTHAPHLRNLM